MQATKRRLTTLRNKIQETLPDENNLYGFDGISRAMILQTIEDSYQNVTALDSFEAHFESILLERKSADYFERVSKLLKENFPENREAFNDFLNTISKFHYRIKETYISVIKEPIRSEAQLNKAKTDYIELQERIEQIRPLAEEMTLMKEDSQIFVDELKERHAIALEKEETIIIKLKEIEELVTISEKSSHQISVWEENITAIKKEIAAEAIRFEELSVKASALNEETEQNVLISKDLKSKLEGQLEDNKIFQQQIQETIENSNRHGMAGSFKKRKDELKTSLLWWVCATIASILILIGFSWYFLVNAKEEDFTLMHYIVRLPVFASCIWLGWFCARQYGFTSRIMEDYSYKYAVSMAFEGYKNATKEIDAELQLKLLQLTIENISNNPLKIYETTSNHGTPFNELAANLPKSTSIKKKVAEMEVEAKVES